MERELPKDLVIIAKLFYKGDISMYTVSSRIELAMCFVLLCFVFNFYEITEWNTVKINVIYLGDFSMLIFIVFHLGYKGHNLLYWSHNQNLYELDLCHRPSNLVQNSAPWKCKLIIIIHLYFRLFKNIPFLVIFNALMKQ